MKKFTLLMLILVASVISKAQVNLITNGSFEDFLPPCPTFAPNGEFWRAYGWQQAQPIPGLGVPHAELFCGQPNYGGCLPGPTPNVGSDGIAYAGFHTRIFAPPYNESIVQVLATPLTAGNSYTLSFDLMDCQSGFFVTGKSDFCVYANFDTLIPPCPKDSPNVVLLGCVPFDSISNVAWKRHSFTFTAPFFCNVLAFSGENCNVAEIYYYLDSVTLYENNGVPVVAALASSDTVFCEKQCIDFFDLSQNTPTSWQWNFTGASPSTSALQNPTGICYNNYGSFDVQLIACNGAGCDTIAYSNFITEYQSPVVTITIAGDTLYAPPGYSYTWYQTGFPANVLGTSFNFVPSVAGTYYVVATDSLGCEVSSNTISVTVGLNELINSHPDFVFVRSEQMIFVKLLSSNKYFQARIIDLTGRIISEVNSFNKSEVNFDVSGLAKGMYLLQLISVQEHATTKFIR
ncbi:MAG: T9SS type A sorting domain-containing protein [Bacteroidetes bacterium]|nr:T9SS type A sorting domain-containing protein [Bacteroidota bacterium]